MRKDIPSLGVLQAFEASARLQSFSRAAEELALTPSAVSRHVAALEARLGVTLFLRTRRRLLLTDTGRSYAARIRLHLGRTTLTDTQAGKTLVAIRQADVSVQVLPLLAKRIAIDEVVLDGANVEFLAASELGEAHV